VSGGQRDEILLELPASGAFARIARVAASSLALRLGVPRARIEDLRLAVDEALVLLLSTAGAGDRIEARYAVDPGPGGGMELTLRLAPTTVALPADAVARFRAIADGLETRSAVDPASGVVLLRLEPA